VSEPYFNFIFGHTRSFQNNGS